ncbi:MAG TPA: hypothetical protein PKH33_11020 [bacterium]|nr:hypothetical protein [bacterium]
MLRMDRASISLEPAQLMELEAIITDEDEHLALKFVRKYVYNAILKSQQGQLKSHLDGSADPVGDFK